MSTEVYVVLVTRSYDMCAPHETIVYHVYLNEYEAKQAVDKLNENERERERKNVVDYTDWYYYLPSYINEDLVER